MTMRLGERRGGSIEVVIKVGRIARETVRFGIGRGPEARHSSVELFMEVMRVVVNCCLPSASGRTGGRVIVVADVGVVSREPPVIAKAVASGEYLPLRRLY